MDAFLGEIRIFGGNYAPRGWAFCHGGLLPISTNPALFSLLGTVYGGDGKVTFGLPDLRGRLPMGNGTGPGLTPRRLGQMIGAESVALTTNQIAAHSHAVYGINVEADETTPTEDMLSANVTNLYGQGNPGNKTLSPQAVADEGEGAPHSNMMYTTAMNYIICIEDGIYPPRS